GDLHENLVLVEGAGGLLVQMGAGVQTGAGPDGTWTVADLCRVLGAPAVVVARAGLGTLNHTALTLEALERRGIPARVVVGAWPSSPELVHVCNLVELPQRAGAVPAAAGSWPAPAFPGGPPGWPPAGP